MSAGGIDSGREAGARESAGVAAVEVAAPASPLVITVHGVPCGQGAIRYSPTGHGYHANGPKLKPWRKLIQTAATDALCDGLKVYDEDEPGPRIVEVTFTLPRPATHYRTGRFAHLLRDRAPGWPFMAAKVGGDIDHLARACLDALTKARVFQDDVQVVELTARKVYVGTGIDALDRPGALIRVWSVAP